jgi:hypothetical protein
MSQSDYIKLKRIATNLKEQAKHDAVYKSTDYTTFKEYSLEKTITSTKPTFNQLRLPGTKTILDVEKKVSDCPSFIVCSGTDDRANRRPLDAVQQSCFPVMKPPGRPMPTLLNSETKKPFPNTKKYRMNCVCRNVSCVCEVTCESPCRDLP